MKVDCVRHLGKPAVHRKNNAYEKGKQSAVSVFTRQKMAYLLPLRSLSCKCRRRVSFVHLCTVKGWRGGGKFSWSRGAMDEAARSNALGGVDSQQ